MSAYAGPEITNSGLVLALDAANQKSLNIPTQADHGYADWYCFVSGTAVYSIVNATGGIIYENNNGTITALVTATTPQRGTISVTAGRTYYGNVPISLVVEDVHNAIAPLTMMGTQFWNIAGRNNPATYYVYSPYQAATVNFYDNTAGGLSGTPTSTLSLSAGQSGTFTSNNLTNHWISSNIPILATVTQTSADKSILSPMSRYVYQRYSAYNNTTNSTIPTTVTNYVVYDSTYNVMTTTIADGSGGDCAQGLGLEYLSDTYSFGNVLSDYVIVAPYNDTVITTYYWSGSAWVAWDSHTLNGTITSPAYVIRDGTAGPGVNGTTINGAATNMASGATLWKWEGNNPFYLCINDSVDDEFSVLGWTRARVSSPRSSVTWTDLSGNGRTGTLTNGPTYSSTNGGSIVFAGASSTYASVGNIGILPSTGTINYWMRSTDVANYRNPFSTHRISGNVGFRWEQATGGTFAVVAGNDAGSYTVYIYTTSLSANTWYMVSLTWNTATSTITGYLNGTQVFNSTTHTQWATTTATDLALGSGYANLAERYYTGNISNAQVYNRALSAAEIQQNFNAPRGRFGV